MATALPNTLDPRRLQIDSRLRQARSFGFGERDRSAVRLTGLFRPYQSVGDQIEEPQLVDLAQVDLSGMLEDEPLHVLFSNQVGIAPLPLSSHGSSELCSKMAGFNPASNDVRIDS